MKFYRIFSLGEFYPAVGTGYRTVAADVGYKWVRAVEATRLGRCRRKKITRAVWNALNPAEVAKPRYVKGDYT